MPTTIIRNVNLLGDTLYTLKPIAEYRMQHPAETVVVEVGAGFAADMVFRQFRGLLEVCNPASENFGRLEADRYINLYAGRAGVYALQHLEKTGTRLHISECFAAMLDVDFRSWNKDVRPLTGWANDGEVLGGDYVVIAPFSRSCARHRHLRPNKTIDHVKWIPAIEWLLSKGLRVTILCGPGEVWEARQEGLDFFYAQHFQQLIDLLRGAKAIITVDNGVSHIASALGCRTLIFWPPVSERSFIAPLWNKDTLLMPIRPDRIRADAVRNYLANGMRI